MKRAVWLATLIVMGVVFRVMAVEEAQYIVLRADGAFELRDYAPHILAETRVDGSMEEAGNRAFRPLFRYISGANHAQQKIAMTAPVGQAYDGQQWVVSFMMPTRYDMDALPTPDNARVVLREVPAQRLAAVRYSGFWSERNYNRRKEELMAWIEGEGLLITGEPVWARYDPPFMPWFMRRNEILIPVE